LLKGNQNLNRSFHVKAYLIDPESQSIESIEIQNQNVIQAQIVTTL